MFERQVDKRLTYRIAPSLRKCVDFQHGIIAWNSFKGDVSMPAYAGKTAGVAQLVGQTATFLLFDAADDADLVPELAPFFGEWVYM